MVSFLSRTQTPPHQSSKSPPATEKAWEVLNNLEMHFCVCVYVYVDVCVHTCTHTCTHMHTHICTHMAHTHAHTPMHTHTHAQLELTVCMCKESVREGYGRCNIPYTPGVCALSDSGHVVFTTTFLHPSESFNEMQV